MGTLENKVDALSTQVNRLSDAIERLVRIEEKYLTLEKDLNGYGQRLTNIEENIQKLSIKTAINSSKGDIIGRWVERLLWIIIIAALSSLELFKHKAG